MPIPCTAKFTATEVLPARAVSSQVYLVLGNYCTVTGITALSSGDFSADYPSSGVIDSDRTELNVGPANGAENNIGKSSWRSSTIPDITDTWLVVDFGTSRTINRIKLYQLVGHEITFACQYWDGGAWQDIFVNGNLGFGNNPFGDTPFGDPSTWSTVNDFADITTTKIKINIIGTTIPGDYANIVEVEAYRLVDISERVISWQTNRNRDFKLRQDMASSVSISCDNTDKFFSPDYLPTAVQIAQGFINSELRSQIGVIIKAGFEWSGSQKELLPQFTGTTDKIEVNSKSRTATIEARDGMKSLFCPLINSTLKTAISIEAAILYVLNLRNISIWDTDLDTSKLIISYFFGIGVDAKTIIDELIQASGDAQFYFDESGMATYRQYTTLIPNNYVYYQKISTQPGQYGWQDYASIDNISLDRQPNQVTIKWPNVDGWANGDYTTNPAWTESNFGSDISPLGISLGHLTQIKSVGGIPYIYLPFTPVYGQWEIKHESFSNFITSIRWTTAIPTRGPAIGGDQIITDGYELNINYNLYIDIYTHFQLYKWTGGVQSLIASEYLVVGGVHTNFLKVCRTTSGLWNIYLNGSVIISATDNTYTTFTHFAVGGVGLALGAWQIDDLYYSNEIYSTANNYDHVTTTPKWISSVLDLGVDIISFGTLESTVYAETNCTPNLYVQTSADGLVFPDGWISVNPNAQITAMPRQYAQIKMEYSSMNYNFGILPTPSLNDMVINWVRSGGTNKYPITSSRAISYDGSLLDITQTTTDTLGGDNSILNDILVVGQPYNLTGADTDIAWEYLTGIPSEVVSIINPLFVNVGTLTFTANISSGMDTSRMTSGACINIVYGTAVGTAQIIFKSPINPVIELTITTAGTISTFQLLGKVFSTAVRNFSAEAKDTTSIKLYDLKSESINNPFIINSGIASQIAATRLANYKDETKILDNVSTTLQPSSQLSDKVTVTDLNTAISADYWVVGIQHFYSASQIYTIYKLWKIP